MADQNTWYVWSTMNNYGLFTLHTERQCLHLLLREVLYWVNGDANANVENGFETILCILCLRHHEDNVKVDIDIDVDPKADVTF